jgi:hypothetical protein
MTQALAESANQTLTDVRDGLTVVIFLGVALILFLAATKSIKSGSDPRLVVSLTVGLLGLAVVVTLAMYGKVSSDAVAGIVGAVLGFVSAARLGSRDRRDDSSAQGPGMHSAS